MEETIDKEWELREVSINNEPIKYHKYKPNIIRGKSEQRVFELIKLENELVFLLINENKIKTSFCSMDVLCGSLNDPDDFLGLAHFCEHLLFMGTEKYQNEDEYSKFLSENGGSSNAYTSLEHTNYHFEVETSHFDKALDMFSEFFKTPKFKKECVEREIKAVDSEHKKNINNDSWRIMQIMREKTNPNERYRRFATGNSETLLKEKVREEIIRLYRENYSSNKMKGVILSNLSIEQLIQLTVEKFHKVENFNLKNRSLIHSPVLTKDELLKQININTISDMKEVILEFPMPDSRGLYEHQLPSILASLIGDEGYGSLYSYLKNKDYIHSLSAGEEELTSGISVFRIQASLTLDGLENYVEVVKQMFTYIHMLKKQNIPTQHVEEIKQINETNFDNMESSNSTGYVSALATSLHDEHYPKSKTLMANYLITKIDTRLLEKYLSFINPLNFRLFLCSQNAVELSKVTPSVEKWYGTVHNVHQISDEKLRYWAKYTPNPNYHLPYKNQFVSSNPSLKNKNSNQNYPYLVHEDEGLLIWYKSDNQFNTPKLSIKLEIISPISYVSALHSVMTDLFIILMTNSLREFVYPAQVAGQSFSISPSLRGIAISFYGYSDKITEFSYQTVKLIKDFRATNQQVLDSKKYDIARSIKNFEYGPLYSQAMYYLGYSTQVPMWSNDQKLKSIQKISTGILNEYVNTLFSTFSLESFISGDCSLKEAVAITKNIYSVFNPKHSIPMNEAKLNQSLRYVVFGTNKNYLYKIHTSNTESLVCKYIQMGSNYDTKQRMTVHVLSQIISQPFFNQLRTVEQLGYVAFSSEKRMGHKQGMLFLVQSTYDCVHLNNRINEFLIMFNNNHIQNLTDQMVDSYVKASIQARLKKSETLFAEGSKFWSLISSGYYEFDTNVQEIEVLKTINSNDIKICFQRYLDINNSKTSSLNIFMIPKNAQILNNNTQYELIDNVDHFKMRMNLCPTFTSSCVAPRYVNSSY